MPPCRILDRCRDLLAETSHRIVAERSIRHDASHKRGRKVRLELSSTSSPSVLHLQWLIVHLKISRAFIIVSSSTPAT
eukprot:scaffold53986_cov27-Tisochrysis_lutea.AAC.1